MNPLALEARLRLKIDTQKLLESEIAYKNLKSIAEVRKIEGLILLEVNQRRNNKLLTCSYLRPKRFNSAYAKYKTSAIFSLKLWLDTLTGK